MVNEKIIDSEGVYDSLIDMKNERYHTQKLMKGLTIKTLEILNNKGDFWNSTFDKRDTKKIEAILEKCYKKVSVNLVVS